MGGQNRQRGFGRSELKSCVARIGQGTAPSSIPKQHFRVQGESGHKTQARHNRTGRVPGSTESVPKFTSNARTRKGSQRHGKFGVVAAHRLSGPHGAMPVGPGNAARRADSRSFAPVYTALVYTAPVYLDLQSFDLQN
jgi:hypothetical protein